MAYSISTDQPNLNGWLQDNFTRPSFTLSYDWQDILTKEGQQTERIAVMSDGKIAAVATVFYQSLPLGQRYAFCPMGPIIHPKEDSSEIFSALKKYFREQNCTFFRVENQTQNPEKFWAEKIKKTRDLNPQTTLILNLAQTTDELLKQMRPKTRYNIRLAQKHGLTIKTEKNPDEFLNLLKKTGHRDGFRLHKSEHYKNILKSSLAHQITVYLRGTPLASGIFVGFDDTFTYLFGASDYGYRNYMAPYLMQWTAIKTGQAYNYRYYDFFGIAPEGAPKNHQYAGVTRFKKGFGGRVVSGSGTYDLIIEPKKYFFYSALRKLKSLLGK